MIRKSGSRFSEEIMLRVKEMESVHGISRPRRGVFRGAGQKLAPSGYLPVEYAPLRRKGLGR
jgi:hypothetical protein